MDNVDVQIKRMALRIQGMAPTDATLYATLEEIGRSLRTNILARIRSNPFNPQRFLAENKESLTGKGPLLNSIVYDVQERSRGGALVVRSKAPAGKYAKYHEFGGTIRAKTKFGLAVPLPHDWVKGKSLRQMGKYLVVRKKSGPKFLGFAVPLKKFDYRHKTPQQKIPHEAISHFLLSHVDIPKRPFFFPAINETIPSIVQILREMPRRKT